MTFEEAAQWLVNFIDEQGYSQLTTSFVGGKFSGIKFSWLITETAKDLMDRCNKAWNWQAEEFMIAAYNQTIIEWQMNKGHQRPPSKKVQESSEIVWWDN